MILARLGLMLSMTLVMCRDLLLPRDLSTATLEEKRQQWLEAAPNLSLTGRKEQEESRRTAI